MSEIVLSTLNARYSHAAFGLRYLLANLGELQPRAALLEFDISQRPVDIAEKLLAREPKIIGLGIYIWNVRQTMEVVSILKRLRPELILILGGPEVSFEIESQPIVRAADYVICGEGDLEFAALCRRLLSGERPFEKALAARPPEFSQLKLPYHLYDGQDLAHRIVYVEASRGCPFSCEFCLSSLDIPVRAAPVADFLAELRRMLDSGARQFKFVDRTFNLNISTGRAILEFLLDRHKPGLFFHFEMIPDRLPGALREVLARFPPGAVQLEVGIQTFNEEVAALIHRRQHYERLEDNLRFLRDQTGVHIHADLIAGLPGESLESFGAGFDRLISLRPHEIQVGILKRLRGTPIVRHDGAWGMVYNSSPPYELLQNKLIEFAQMQALRRFARYWDLVGNSGNFVETVPLIWGGTASIPNLPAGRGVPHSPFQAFMRWSDWLYARTARTDGIALARLMQLLFEYLTVELETDPEQTANLMWNDYQRGGRSDKPVFLRKYLPDKPIARPSKPPLPKRQRRHLSLGTCVNMEES